MAEPPIYIDQLELRAELDAMLKMQLALHDLCTSAMDAARSEELQAVTGDLRRMADELGRKLADLDARFPRPSAH